MRKPRLEPGHYQAIITHILPASYVNQNTGIEQEGIFVAYKIDYEGRFSVTVTLSGFHTSKLTRTFGKLIKAHGHRPGEMMNISDKLMKRPVGLEVKPNGTLEFYRLAFDDVPSVDSLNLPSVDDAFPDPTALEV